MIGDDFKDKFQDYMRQVNDGKWLEFHYRDPRNSDDVADRIQLDTDSRKVIQYLDAIKEMVNDLRRIAGLEIMK